MRTHCRSHGLGYLPASPGSRRGQSRRGDTIRRAQVVVGRATTQPPDPVRNDPGPWPRRRPSRSPTRPRRSGRASRLRPSRGRARRTTPPRHRARRRYPDARAHRTPSAGGAADPQPAGLGARPRRRSAGRAVTPAGIAGGALRGVQQRGAPLHAAGQRALVSRCRSRLPAGHRGRCRPSPGRRDLTGCRRIGSPPPCRRPPSRIRDITSTPQEPMRAARSRATTRSPTPGWSPTSPATPAMYRPAVVERRRHARWGQLLAARGRSDAAWTRRPTRNRTTVIRPPSSRTAPRK